MEQYLFKCHDCKKEYTFEEGWCNECDPNRFLGESKTIGCYKKLDELSKNEKYRFKYYGICLDCKQMNTGRFWCNKCDPGRFLREGKTSGNAKIDELIHEAQLKTKDYYDNLGWIPFDRLIDIKPIGGGGFANVYSATWLDGEPEWNRSKIRFAPITVALKKLKNLNNTTEAF